MTDMNYLAEALAYHTKGRKAVLEQTELKEKKCSCCDADPCSCDDDCGCKKSVSEGQDLKNDKNANGIDDKDESEAKDNVVKKTDAKADKKVEEVSEMDEAAKPITFGPNSNVKANNKPTMQQPDKDKNRARFGQDNIQVKKSDAERKKAGTGYKPNKQKAADIHRLNGDHARADELEKEHRKDMMRAANAKIQAKKMTKEEVEDELMEHALDLHEMIQDLNAMFIEEDLSLTEAFQAAAMSDEELEEGFQTMSKVKQAIARKKAGRRKKLTIGYSMNRNKPFNK